MAISSEYLPTGCTELRAFKLYFIVNFFFFWKTTKSKIYMSVHVQWLIKLYNISTITSVKLKVKTEE